jgi:hypothetical protein
MAIIPHFARKGRIPTSAVTTAKVTCDLLLSGKPVLTNQSGIAVLQDAIWKVGTATLHTLRSVAPPGLRVRCGRSRLLALYRR